MTDEAMMRCFEAALEAAGEERPKRNEYTLRDQATPDAEYLATRDQHRFEGFKMGMAMLASSQQLQARIDLAANYIALGLGVLNEGSSNWAVGIEHNARLMKLARDLQAQIAPDGVGQSG